MANFVVRNAADMEQALTQMDQEVQAFFDNVQLNMPTAMRRTGTSIMRETIPITPLDTGALRNSGKFDVERKNKDQWLLTVSFGDEKVFYAKIVHDMPFSNNFTEPFPPLNELI